MSILVSNANGTVGSEVVKALLKAGEVVRIGARDVAKAKTMWPDADIVALDLLDAHTLPSAVEGVKAVFSAVPFELLPAADEALVTAAKAAGVTRFVKLSAMLLELDPDSPHAVAERAIMASGLEWTMLRPTFFMQNYATSMAGAVRQGTIYEPADNGATSFVDVRDIADVAVHALTGEGHAGKGYVMAGPAALTRTQVADTLSKVSGRPVGYVAVDDAALRQALTGAPEAVIDLMSKLYGYVREGFTAVTTTDIETVTGRPARSFATFARDHADAWR